MRLWGRVRPGSLPLCQLSGLPGSQTLAFQWLLDALSSDHCWLGGGMRWGQGTINLPACVCVYGGGVWVRWGWCKIHVLFFWKPGLGSDKGRRGERIVPPKHLSCLCWGPCPGFRELGHRQPPQIAEALQTYKCGLSGDLEQHNLF